MSLIRLTRRSDGKVFQIELQARSPNGPVTLVAEGPTSERVETTNDRLLVDFIDVRQTHPMSIATDRGCSFGTALALMLRGLRVRRKGWEGAWIRRVDLYNDPEFKLREEPCAVGTWLPFIAMKTDRNALAPWVPSQEDALATDWFEVDAA